MYLLNATAVLCLQSLLLSLKYFLQGSPGLCNSFFLFQYRYPLIWSYRHLFSQLPTKSQMPGHSWSTNTVNALRQRHHLLQYLFLLDLTRHPTAKEHIHRLSFMENPLLPEHKCLLGDSLSLGFCFYTCFREPSYINYWFLTHLLKFTESRRLPFTVKYF